MERRGSTPLLFFCHTRFKPAATRDSRDLDPHFVAPQQRQRPGRIVTGELRFSSGLKPGGADRIVQSGERLANNQRFRMIDGVHRICHRYVVDSVEGSRVDGL
jgi:hypothetical protein